MTITANVVTVGTTPTLLLTAAANGGLTGDPRQSVTVRNTSATADAFLGGPGVTSGTGMLLPVGASLTVPLAQGDRLHAVVAVGTAPVAVLSSN